MKKINKVVSLSAVTLALMGTGASQVLASEWYANTPSEIGELNNDGTYTVRNGDTIWAIGVHFNIKPTVIEEVNHVTDPYLLQIGTILKLHIDKENDKATIEAITPDGQKHEKVLTQKDKIVEHKKFGENVEKEITPKEEKKDYYRFNQTNNNAIDDVSKSTNQQNMSNEQLAMASYQAWYGIYNNPAPSIGNHVYFEKDAKEPNTYWAGQGTADSTVKITINGDKIEYDGGGNGTTPAQKNTLTRQEVIDKYYSTQEQKDKINNAIKNAQHF